MSLGTSTAGISALIVTSTGRVDIRELEAESVARVVFASLAPGVRLPDHLSQNFAEEPDLAGASLEAVLKAAGRILDIASGWGPRWKSGDQKPARSK
jgi:hypothetical protein